MNRPTGLGPDSILGIDLGTTNTLLSWYDGECSRILAPEGSNGDSQALLPSVVAILEDGTELVGEAAKAMALQHPTRVIHSVKRLIGRSLTEIRVEAERLPYEVVESASGQVRIRIRLDGKEGRPAFKDYSPEEISALVLREVHARAFEAMAVPIEERPRRIVLTVPAYFDDAQRQASKNAAKIAGLEALRLVNEPTAASLAYGLGKDKQGRILVYDLGGGTFDVSILRVSDGIFRVLSTHGDTQLGGDDIDRVLLDFLLAKIEERTGASLGQDPMVLSTLRRSAEGLKKRLSEAQEAELLIDHGGTEDLALKLTRSEFEEMISPLIERTTRSLRSALQDAELDPSQIDDVVLVGGSTRIPLVHTQLEAYFGKPPHCELDPDLAIAMGAATQASVLAGAQDDLLLMDVVPLSLGIETLGGAFSKLILRNSTVPCSQTEEFTTRVEKQTGIELNVYQGERELITDCRKIGHLKLSGIPAMKAGLPRVAVTFSVDADGILRVSARELRSGQTASAEIQATLGLGESQVQAIVMESIEKAGEDFVAREALELGNKARALIQGTEQVLASGGDEALAPEQSYAIHKALKKLKKLADGDDVQALHAAVDRLGSLTMQLADEMIGASVRKALSTSNTTSTPTTEASAETSGDQA